MYKPSKTLGQRLFFLLLGVAELAALLLVPHFWRLANTAKTSFFAGFYFSIVAAVIFLAITSYLSFREAFTKDWL